MALIGFDEYHMGPSMANPDADGLSSLAKILEKSNHKLEMIQDEYDITQELPWDVIVIPFPKEKFSVEEMMALQTHLRSGKSILLLAEWGDLYGHVDYLNELTKTFGIEIQKDRVTDHQQHITKKMELGGVVLGEKEVPHYVKITNFTEHEITSGVNQLIYFSGCSLKISEPAFTIAATSESSFGDIDLDSELDDDEIQGELTIAAASEINGKLFVIGDSNIAANGYIEQGDNLLFMQQVIDWLAHKN